MSNIDIDIKGKVSQKQLAKMKGVSRRKLQLMAAAGILVPFKVGDTRFAPCYYTEEQDKNFPDYLQAYDEWKKVNRNKLTDNADVSVSLFSGSEYTNVPKTFAETSTDETDGSEEDNDNNEMPALVPVEDSDDDDELIDPPTDSDDFQSARADDTGVPTADAPLANDDHEVDSADLQSVANSSEVPAAPLDTQNEQAAISQPLADAAPAVDTAADVFVEIVDNKQARIAEAKKFFNLLFGKIPARHFSYLIKFSGGTNTYDFEVADETQLGAMAIKAVELSDSGVDIWHAVNPVSVKPHYEFDEAKKKNVFKRGDEAVVSYQTAIVTDIDVFGAAHKSPNLAADFAEAKSFLPFPPSILIDSGHGVQAYFLFDKPLVITDDNREEIKRRNKLLLDVIRIKANGKTIDAVDDLPRILRTPGTFNYKLGRDNAPMCRVVEVNDIRFTPADIDERLNALTPQLTAPPEPARATDTQNPATRKLADLPLDDSSELKAFRIRHMLPYISVVKGEYNKWLQVGMGLYNEGIDLADWENWSRTQPEFKEGECESKWQGFHHDPNGITIATLYQWAVEGGYDEKETQREFYELHPELSKKKNTSAQIEQLKADLREVAQKIAEFDAQRDAALERLKNIETFDSKTVFADDVIEAAAFAKLYDRQAFSSLRCDIKNYGDKHKETKASVIDWLAEIRDKAEEISSRRSDLSARQISIQAQINAVTFIANNDILQKLKFPIEYSISKSGVEKVSGENMITVCRQPVIITGTTLNVDDKILKYTLAYMTHEEEWKYLEATASSTVFNNRKLIDLADAGLAVTSSNANLIVDYLDVFRKENEIKFPMTYAVSRAGWHTFNGTEYFIDPRRDCVIDDKNKKARVVIESSSQFAKSLYSKGTLAEWKRAYELAKKSPIARLIIAAAVAPPLLNILGERNFWVHINAPTRAGKTTALILGASAVGSEKIIRSFDATKNGLVGAAADVNDYVFCIDEKQSADKKISGQFANLIYSLCNGTGRTKQKRDSTNMVVPDWRTIILTTGETEMTPDNATDGTDTRLLPINAPKNQVILLADICKQIRDITKENFGHALPLVVDKIIEHGKENLRSWYHDICDAFKEAYPDILDEYRRYMAILVLADGLLNSGLGIDKALPDATQNAGKIFPLIPTLAEISVTAKEKTFVLGFMAQNQSRFISKQNGDFIPVPALGILDDEDGYYYITARALQDACNDLGYFYRKLVDDLIAAGFFVPSDKIAKGCTKPRKTVQKKVGKVNTECYKIPKDFFDSIE